MSAWVFLKNPCHRYLPGGTYVSFQKRLNKVKYGFHGSTLKCQSWLVLAKQPINFSFVSFFGSVKSLE